jgi:2-(1,2-epoxy-1,2-dihydrophenyl)acetyl-CoA isomerase
MTGVAVHVVEGIATVTLDHAPGNPIGLTVARELSAAVQRCEDTDVRAVLLTATGPSFCVGGDLREFGALDGAALGRHLDTVTGALHDAIKGLTALNAPVVAGVHGNIAGAGVSLLCAADYVIAAEDATFTLAYTGIGYTPDGGATWLLPRLLGQRRAMELLLLNRRLTAAEALDWGLVSAVAPTSDHVQHARTVVARLADGPTGAFGASKRLVNTGWTTSLPEALSAESRQLAASATSSEGRTGTVAFLNKQRPNFRAS